MLIRVDSPADLISQSTTHIFSVCGCPRLVHQLTGKNGANNTTKLAQWVNVADVGPALRQFCDSAPLSLGQQWREPCNMCKKYTWKHNNNVTCKSHKTLLHRQISPEYTSRFYAVFYTPPWTCWRETKPTSCAIPGRIR